jgi:hypothetical protein
MGSMYLSTLDTISTASCPRDAVGFSVHSLRTSAEGAAWRFPICWVIAVS